jgi:hypothetical protein
MKKLQFCLKFCSQFLLIFLFCTQTHPNAQSPNYYNYQINENTNFFPFGVELGKGVQWLFMRGNFNQPAQAPPGYITKIYFYMGFTNGNSTLYNLTILLGQTTLTDLPVGVVYTGQLDTVYFRETVNLISTVGHWMSITLDNPYLYDTSLSLIVEVCQCGATNISIVICQHAYTGLKRCYMNFTSGNHFVFSGQDEHAVNFGFDITPLEGINNKNSDIPNSFSLYQNYPNPFNPATKIKFVLPKSSFTKLIICDILGIVVKTLVNEELKPGSYEYEWDGSNFPGGVYFYKLITADFIESKKMILIK